jgi:Protein of unknown function (DUF2750)
MDMRAPVLSNAAIDRFVGRVLDAEAAWTVAGEEGLVRVASPTAKARMATLLWSERAEAERWGSLIAEHPRTKRLSLPDLLNEVLPKLSALNRLVGLDWGSQPLEPESEPADLTRRLRAEAVAQFVRMVNHREVVWVLQGADGPVCLMSKSRPGAQMLPCWYDNAHAEARIAGPLADRVAAAVPLAAFRDRMLLWLGQTGRLVAPGYCEGDGLVELAPADLAAQLTGAAKPHVTAA